VGKTKRIDWIHGAKEGWRREEEGARKKSREGGAMGSDGGVRIFTHKGTQFANC